MDGSLNLILGNYIGLDAAGSAGIGNTDGVILSSTAQNNQIGGTTAAARNVISGNYFGINDTGTGTVIQGNYIGPDVTGTVVVWNHNGIATGGNSSTIGGTAPGAGNLISFNYIGLVTYAGSQVVLGNLIGTDKTGTIGLGNANGGISTSGGNILIGGTSAAARNIISANGGFNVLFFGGAAVIQGNYIGPDVTGTIPLTATMGGILVANGATGCTIGGTSAGAGNVLSGNLAGVYLDGFANVIEGNRIGTDPTGTTAVPNTWGIFFDSNASGNTIGGTVAAARNLISGNLLDGVLITGANATGNLIRGNYIGTDVTGTLALANGRDGVLIEQGANGNTVGGASSTATNIISGNGGSGVHLASVGTTNNSIIRNRIGTDVTGTAKIGNTIGVQINQGASNNLVGGTSAADRNIISGNSRIGVGIGGNNSNANRVEGNYIGTDWTGSVALSNPVGVKIFRLAKNNIIGGTSLSKTNVISGNSSVGVLIRDNGTTGNLVQWNYIGTDPTGNSPIPNRVGVTIDTLASGSLIDGNGIEFNAFEGILVDNAISNRIRINVIRDNGGKGIRLINNGNNLQPFPTITSIINGGGSITISGNLNAAPSTTYALEFFSNPVCDGSGFGEGRYFIGTQSFTTNGTGFVAFAPTFTANVPSGYMITSTATSPTTDTSEFSACVLAPLPPAPDAPPIDLHPMTPTPLAALLPELGLASASPMQVRLMPTSYQPGSPSNAVPVRINLAKSRVFFENSNDVSFLWPFGEEKSDVLVTIPRQRA